MVVSSLIGSKITTGLTLSLLQWASVVTGKLVSDFEGIFASLRFGVGVFCLVRFWGSVGVEVWFGLVF